MVIATTGVGPVVVVGGGKSFAAFARLVTFDRISTAPCTR